ncbi:hypothetical protein BLOT_008831 [Blomia tropicalis]|nr:hypothetical protein BLOT_008831 [Blomia tropicalis]
MNYFILEKFAQNPCAPRRCEISYVLILFAQILYNFEVSSKNVNLRHVSKQNKMHQSVKNFVEFNQN